MPIAANGNYATPVPALLLRLHDPSGTGTALQNFLVRSEGDRIFCDINELSKFVKP
jgi:hypothetical protein